MLWSPLKNMTPEDFTIANFRHLVSKSWLRPCLSHSARIQIHHYQKDFRTKHSVYGNSVCTLYILTSPVASGCMWFSEDDIFISYRRSRGSSVIINYCIFKFNPSRDHVRNQACISTRKRDVKRCKAWAVSEIEI